MASKSVLIVALLFYVPILCLQGTYAYSIEGDASASASASASGAIGGFGNGNWDSQGYGDDEERTAAPWRRRCEWTKSLREKFMLAITHIGLDNATPTRILEFMNEPDLTLRHVASHLQKYRKFLKDKKVAEDAGDEDMLERLGRSSFALGQPQLLNQQQMGTSIGSTFQPSDGIGSTPPLTAAASNNHGTIQFSNDQQSSTSDASRSIPQLIGSGQSSLLNNNGDQLFCQENCPAAFGMQQPSNNFENGGNVEGYLYDNFMMLPPDEQQQDGGHDQLPYQVEVPDPAANQVPNPSADQVPNPGPYYVEDNAPNGTILEPGVLTLSELDDNTWHQYMLAASELGFDIWS